MRILYGYLRQYKKLIAFALLLAAIPLQILGSG